MIATDWIRRCPSSFKHQHRVLRVQGIELRRELGALEKIDFDFLERQVFQAQCDAYAVGGERAPKAVKFDHVCFSVEGWSGGRRQGDPAPPWFKLHCGDWRTRGARRGCGRAAWLEAARPLHGCQSAGACHVPFNPGSVASKPGVP